MSAIKSLNDVKIELDLLSLEIESFNDHDKLEAVKHLEETLGILKFGSSLDFNKGGDKMMIEASSQTEPFTNTFDKVEARKPSVKPEPEPVTMDEESVKKMYNGFIPTCEDCGAVFPTLGALDAHGKAEHKQEVPKEKTMKVEQEAQVKEESSEVVTKSTPSVTEKNVVECGPCNVKIKAKNMRRHSFGPNHKLNEARMKEALTQSQPVEMKPSIDVEQVVKENKSNIMQGNTNQEFSCGDCGNKYSIKHSYLRHIITHTDKYKCSGCAKGFSDNTGLSRHVKTCNQLSKVIDELSSQNTTVENVGKRKRSEEAEEKGGRKEAKLSQMDESQFNCRECEAVLPSNKSFASHMAIHSEDFKCDECGSCYGSSFNLRRHRSKVHKLETSATVASQNGVREFQCDLCDKFFSSVEKLQDHKDNCAHVTIERKDQGINVDDNTLSNIPDLVISTRRKRSIGF